MHRWYDTRCYFNVCSKVDIGQLNLPHGAHTHTRLTALFQGLPWWAGTRKVKQIWILLKQETMSDSGISWAIYKSASRSRQITMPAPHHSIFLQTGCPSYRPTNSVKALKAHYCMEPQNKSERGKTKKIKNTCSEVMVNRRLLLSIIHACLFDCVQWRWSAMEFSVWTWWRLWGWHCSQHSAAGSTITTVGITARHGTNYTHTVSSCWISSNMWLFIIMTSILCLYSLLFWILASENQHKGTSS